ncbi:MAG: hypothetical protein LBV13_03540 [Methanomassiliicoccaceae archaeon]|jgi:hypothetical protein|nr:hypothetical protein [Methanomassiliicoccaceae archaeon]
MTKTIDPTSAGLFLVGFITLLFGLLGFNLFSDPSDVGLLSAIFDFIFVIGILMVIIAWMAGRAGNAYATALFAFIAVAIFGASFGATAGLEGDAVAPTIFYALALFFIVFLFVAAMLGTPKLLIVLLFFVALLYLFVGVYFGEGDKPFAGAVGVFGLLSFFTATYFAAALSTQKLPVF